MDDEGHVDDTDNDARNSMLYVDQFRHHLSQLQAQTDRSGSDYIPPTGYWTPSEKDIFFHALSVYSTLRPDLIAAHLPHKSVVDVCAYIDLLAEASAKDQNHLSRCDFNISMEVSEDWIRLEEVEGAQLSIHEGSWDNAAQRRANQEFVHQEETRLFGDNTDHRHPLRDEFDSWKSTHEASWARLDALKCMTPKQLTVLDSILSRDDDSEDTFTIELAGDTVSLEQVKPVQTAPSVSPGTSVAVAGTSQTGDRAVDPILIAESSAMVAEQSPATTALSSLTPPPPSPTPSPSIPDIEPTPDLSQLSPKSRRRYQKRLYMRRKRAEANGGEVVHNIGKLRPGRKQKSMLPKKKTMEEKISNEYIQSGEESCDNEEAQRQLSNNDHGTTTQERDGSCGLSTQTPGNTRCAEQQGDVEVEVRAAETEFHHRRASGKMEAAKFKQLLEERGLLNVSPLGRLMKTYKSVYEEPTDHPTVNTTISADTFRLLHAIIVEFTTNVIRRSIVYREQDNLLKANRKVWKGDRNVGILRIISDVFPQHIKHALHMMGMPHLLNLMRSFGGDEDAIDAENESVIDTESSNEADEKVEGEGGKEEDSDSESEGSIECDEQEDSMTLPLYREMNPAVIRLSSYLCSSSEDILMSSDTDEELLMEELEEESDLDEQDTLLEQKYQQDLWDMGFQPIE
ncbi:uncharacterized protein EV420DRAFT_1477929 [Desarmillaria tabescens]|uniref:Myb-like domain-containing protein n=1 Tax=Armillaria tabescens TaxID=1929756 RepID=A0AA39N8Q5_ARMTA|nr:uncharacterized protein EV420DRAFT_1477929 [Desarmillaria tabescens]KAK0461089.1 hypothetical protein EV420DRAFT_1477929 [Desarmillaria tabescens]